MIIQLLVNLIDSRLAENSYKDNDNLDEWYKKNRIKRTISSKSRNKEVPLFFMNSNEPTINENIVNLVNQEDQARDIKKMEKNQQKESIEYRKQQINKKLNKIIIKNRTKRSTTSSSNQSNEFEYLKTEKQYQSRIKDVETLIYQVKQERKKGKQQKQQLKYVRSNFCSLTHRKSTFQHNLKTTNQTINQIEQILNRVEISILARGLKIKDIEFYKSTQKDKRVIYFPDPDIREVIECYIKQKQQLEDKQDEQINLTKNIWDMDYQIKEIHNQISDIEKEASMHQLQIDAAVFEIRDQLQRLLREQDTIPLHFIIKFYYKIKINVYENDLPKFLNENQKELILKIGQLEYEIDKLRNKANKQNLLLKSSCISSENSNKYTQEIEKPIKQKEQMICDLESEFLKNYELELKQNNSRLGLMKQVLCTIFGRKKGMQLNEQIRNRLGLVDKSRGLKQSKVVIKNNYLSILKVENELNSRDQLKSRSTNNMFDELYSKSGTPMRNVRNVRRRVKNDMNDVNNVNNVEQIYYQQ